MGTESVSPKAKHNRMHKKVVATIMVTLCQAASRSHGGYTSKRAQEAAIVRRLIARVATKAAMVRMPTAKQLVLTKVLPFQADDFMFIGCQI